MFILQNLQTTIFGFRYSDSMCCHSAAVCLPTRLCATSKLPWQSVLLVLLLFLAILPDFSKVLNLHDTKIPTNMIAKLMLLVDFCVKSVEQNCTLYGHHKNSKLSKTQKPTKIRWVFGFLTSPGCVYNFFYQFDSMIRRSVPWAHSCMALIERNILIIGCQTVTLPCLSTPG
jgi:hypothetical protein